MIKKMEKKVGKRIKIKNIEIMNMKNNYLYLLIILILFYFILHKFKFNLI